MSLEVCQQVNEIVELMGILRSLSVYYRKNSLAQHFLRARGMFPRGGQYTFQKKKKNRNGVFKGNVGIGLVLVRYVGIGDLNWV